MDEMISATEANRSFSSLLRRVREEGKAFTVTSHGERVARLLPCRSDDANRKAAREALLRRLAEQPVIDAGRWSRDDLYER
jgi:prevent-host-death family protein